MNDSADREPIELLAEEFMERRRKGERVSVEDYAGAYPDQAEEIRDLFPTIAALEEAKSDDKPNPTRAFDCPERLGDLRIIREIGRGGMGVVYEAVQESLERRVAVKVLPGRTLFDTKQLERFRREARTAGALQHPGIVPVYSVGEQDGLHYLVMQLVDGAGLDVLTRRVGARTKTGSPGSASSLSLTGDKTVAARLEDGLAAALLTGDFDAAVTQEIPLTLPGSQENPTIAFSGSGSLADSVRATSLGQALAEDDSVDLAALDGEYYRSIAKVGAQAAEALGHAHSRGTLHRDIKPANLLLDRTGRVWITDFGLAKAVDQNDLSRTGEVLGTLRYMAPEQLRGQATTQSDLYALGLTLYELVTFRSPFEAATPSEVLQKINEHRPERPSKINPNLPADLERIIVRAMSASPAERYATGEDLAADLRRFLGDQPVSAANVPLTTQVQRWASRHRTAALALAAFALVSCGIAVGMIIFLAAPHPPPGFPPPGGLPPNLGEGAGGAMPHSPQPGWNMGPGPGGGPDGFVPHPDAPNGPYPPPREHFAPTHGEGMPRDHRPGFDPPPEPMGPRRPAAQQRREMERGDLQRRPDLESPVEREEEPLE